MPVKTRMVISIVASLFIAVLVTKTFFLSDSPKINTHFISAVPEKTKEFIAKLTTKKISSSNNQNNNVSPTGSNPQITPQITQSPNYGFFDFWHPVPTRTITLGVPRAQPTPTTYISPTLPSTRIPTATSAPVPTWQPGPIYPTAPAQPTPTTIARLSPTSPPVANCSSSGNSYGSIRTVSDYTLGKPAGEHPEINLALRGYTMINETKSTVHYGGDTDPNAQKINSLFADGRRPTIINTYCIYAWDYTNNVRSTDTECGTPPVKWPVTLIGLATQAGERLVIPPSGREIGGGNTLMVLYVDNNRITFTNSTGDNWTDGYTMHVEDVCVDPALVALYNQDDAAGRGELPALPRGAVFGYSKSGEIKVAIRDSGVFMDPRSDKDWW